MICVNKDLVFLLTDPRIDERNLTNCSRRHGIIDLTHISSGIRCPLNTVVDRFQV
jgi:hypothetical protein